MFVGGIERQRERSNEIRDQQARHLQDSRLEEKLLSEEQNRIYRATIEERKNAKMMKKKQDKLNEILIERNRTLYELQVALIENGKSHAQAHSHAQHVHLRNLRDESRAMAARTIAEAKSKHVYETKLAAVADERNRQKEVVDNRVNTARYVLSLIVYICV